MVVTGGTDGTVRLWDLSLRNSFRVIPLGASIVAMSLAKGKVATVAVGTSRGLLVLDFFLSPIAKFK